MKMTVVAATLGLLVPCSGSARGSNNQNVRFEFGTTLNAVLSHTVDARKSKPGDIVKAKSSEDLKAAGNIVIPRGTKLLGRVTEAQVVATAGDAARLGFAFDRAELKDGRKITLHTSFYALAAPEGVADGRSPPAGGGYGSGFGGGSPGVRSMARPAADDTSALGVGNARHVDLKPSPAAIGGLNTVRTLYASSRGVFGLDDVSLEPNTVPSNGSAVILANTRTVHLFSGTRMLLSVESTK
jgi:CubicO group peptidase (beta-lactamase class C family)